MTKKAAGVTLDARGLTPSSWFLPCRTQRRLYRNPTSPQRMLYDDR